LTAKRGYERCNNAAGQCTGPFSFYGNQTIALPIAILTEIAIFNTAGIILKYKIRKLILAGKMNV
jgi:hypothetical protein